MWQRDYIGIICALGTYCNSGIPYMLWGNFKRHESPPMTAPFEKKDS